MEGLSLSEQARKIAQQVVWQKRKEAEAHEAECAKRAGPVPVMTDPIVLEACLIYLEGKILEAAKNGENSVLVPYKEIPAVAERWGKIVYISESLAKKELHQSADYIKLAFIKKHPDFESTSHKDVATIVHFFNDKLKITF
jgi:hypothetical protein